MRGNYGGANDFEVLVDGVVVGDFLPTVTTYAICTTTSFTVTAGSHNLEFKALDTVGGDNTVFLDAISIVDPPPIAETVVIASASTRMMPGSGPAHLAPPFIDDQDRPVDALALTFWSPGLDEADLPRVVREQAISVAAKDLVLDAQSLDLYSTRGQVNSGDMEDHRLMGGRLGRG
jgi:hypothetical protein